MLADPERFPLTATNDPVAAIVDFRDQLAAYGIRLLVLPVPNKDSVYPDRLSSRAKNLQGVLATRTREILAKLKEADVEVLDLFQEFRKARQPSGSTYQAPLYLAQDTHWSPAGVALAAKAAAHRLIDLGWVRTGEINYTEQSAPVQRIGDLVRMLQSPMIEQSLTPESIASIQVLQDSKPYSDDPNSEILILGDSFLRIYQQDTPTSAGFVAHLARELNRPRPHDRF